MPGVYKPQRSRRFIDMRWCPEFIVDTIRCPSDVLVGVEFANSVFYIAAGYKRKVRQRHFLAFLFPSPILGDGGPIMREPVGIFSKQFRLDLLPRRIIANGHIVNASLGKALCFQERPKRRAFVGMDSGY